MSNLLKNLLIALGLAIILFVGYVVFIKGDSSSDSGLITESSPSGTDLGLETQQLLASLNELKSLDIDGRIFSDPLFASFRDFRTELGTEPEGRSNPFAPVQ